MWDQQRFGFDFRLESTAQCSHKGSLAHRLRTCTPAACCLNPGAKLVRLARTAAEGTVTCTHTHAQCTREVHPCRRTSHRGTCYVSAGCSASELNLGTNSTWPTHSTLQQSVMEAKSSKVPGRRFSRDPGLTELPLRLPAFSTVHHYVLAASLTGPVMHCAIWGLRHKLDQEQQPTVCAGPARARFGSIAWPSDSFLEVGRKDQGPVIAPRSPASAIFYL